MRSRGVVEKCSFCIQRIRAATAEATRDGKDRKHYPDGAVVPACMEACPTGAITFIDANWTGLGKMQQWANKLGNQASAA